MTSPLYFVGMPDWRSALLAVLFALPWLTALAWGRLRCGWLWAAVAAGAVLFPLSIAWLQVPLQQALSALWVTLLGLEGIRRYLLLVSLPSLVVASAVQEGAKLVVAILALRLARARGDGQAGLAFGGAGGAGYGGFEAFWTLNAIFAAGWSWATVQLGGPAALLGFAERLYAVPFHVGSAALAAYGYATGRTWRYLLLAVGLHTLLNYGIALAQAGLLGTLAIEVWGALVAVATISAALWLRYRERTA